MSCSPTTKFSPILPMEPSLMHSYPGTYGMLTLCACTKYSTILEERHRETMCSTPPGLPCTFFLPVFTPAFHSMFSFQGLPVRVPRPVLHTQPHRPCCALTCFPSTSGDGNLPGRHGTGALDRETHRAQDTKGHTKDTRPQTPPKHPGLPRHLFVFRPVWALRHHLLALDAPQP
jgi:hypothetical protein